MQQMPGFGLGLVCVLSLFSLGFNETRTRTGRAKSINSQKKWRPKRLRVVVAVVFKTDTGFSSLNQIRMATLSRVLKGTIYRVFHL
jgi:hypothetical protein